MSPRPWTVAYGVHLLYWRRADGGDGGDYDYDYRGVRRYR